MHKTAGVELSLINLHKIEDSRGNLTFIEEESHIPFKIKRVYWIYDVPGGEQRGGHAFKSQQELVVALSGSFDVIINHGHKEERFHLNRSYFGLYIPSGLWRHMENFSTNAVVMVLSSTLYSEEDYIRSFSDYLSHLENEKLSI
jgi:dTDP-4-dehydrorhamnose 3,5-epimerase-like enzyme